MTQREKELTEQVEQLTHHVGELRKELVAAYAKLDAANAKIAELEERINKNSQNSSKPPSTDGRRVCANQRAKSKEASVGIKGPRYTSPKNRRKRFLICPRSAPSARDRQSVKK